MRLNVLLGVDVSAYAAIDAAVPDDASEEQIVDVVRKLVADNMAMFTPEWDSARECRIVYAEAPGRKVFVMQHRPIDLDNVA